jgi:uncharacterized protein (TIGR01777 family)
MAAKQVILITGGSGLIGNKLKALFTSQGHEVRLLGRGFKDKKTNGKYHWDPEKGEMDESALEDVTWLIHLAGEPVAGKLWTKERKKAITDSRIESTKLLISTIEKTGFKPQKVLCASAVGYYGSVTTDEIFTEKDTHGKDFLAEVCVLWETETAKFKLELDIQTVIIRIGVVLAEEGGALQEIVKPMRFVMGAILGTGKQWVPWIHIDDLVGIMSFALNKKEAGGIYNAVAPQFTNFKQLTEAAAKSLKRFVAPFHVPKFALKVALGEQAVIVLEGSRISPDKIITEGYEFQFTDVQQTMDNLLV